MGVASTSLAAMSDVVVILRDTSDGDNSPWFLGQRDRSNGDLQRCESIQRDSTSVILVRSEKRSECLKNGLDGKRAYCRLDAPVEVVPEIGRDDSGFE